MQVAGGCGWVQSPVTLLPEELFTDSISFEQKQVFEASMDFVWRSPLLDAAEVVAALQRGQASMELWLRTACVPSSQSSWRVSGQLAADVRLAEASLNLKNLLRASSPEEPQKLRLRTLRNVSIDPTVAFRTDKNSKNSNVLADLISSLSMDLPNGPSVVSWLVEPDESDTLVNYVIKLREVWLSKELVASLNQAERNAYTNTGRGNISNLVQGPQYFYAEFGQGGPNGLGGATTSGAPTATLPYYRSAPVAAQTDASGWLRVPLESDARVVLPKCPVLGVSAAIDVQIRRGDFHSMRVRVLQLMRGGGTRLAADVALQLPLGEVKDGGNGSFFGVHMWRPLFHSAPEAPALAIVGRALLSVEAEHPHDQVGAPQRVLQSLPQMPTGVYLPLYSSWKVPVDASPWPLEVILREFIDAMHPDLWPRLSELEKHLGTKGAVPAEEFEIAFEAVQFGRELSFFKSAVSAFFSPPVCSVPWLAVLYWFALRIVATRVLPVMPRLLHRLQQIDQSRGRLTGTVPLSIFQQALFDELTTAPVPAEWTYLREFISQRPQWSVGANQFCGHEYFDYFAFFWDLNASGTALSVDSGLPPFMGSQIPPLRPLQGAIYPPDVPMALGHHPRRLSSDLSVEQNSMYRDPPLAMITIASAHHLMNVAPNQPPNTFVTYAWGHKDGMRQGETLGTTQVIANDNNPKWNHAANIVLPRIVIANTLLPYPEAFRQLHLVLQVWGLNEWHGTQRLIGTAWVPLAPLRSGFAEVDGYYKIEGVEEGIQIGHQTEHRVHPDQGQIRISITPHWAPSPAAPDRQKIQSSQLESWPLGSYTCPSSIFVEPQVLDLGDIAFPSRSSKEELSEFHLAPSVSVPPVVPSSQDVASRLPSYFASPNLGELASHTQRHQLALFEPIEHDLQPVGQGPGVKDDVCTTALRFASGLSAIERQLRALEGSEEVQLEALRERHLNNLAALDQLQQEKLQKLTYPPIDSTPAHRSDYTSFQALPSQVDTPIGVAPPALGVFSAPEVPLPSKQIQQPPRAQCADPEPSLRPLEIAELLPRLAPLPPPAEPPLGVARQTRIEASVRSEPASVPKAIWPSNGGSNLLPKSGSSFEEVVSATVDDAKTDDLAASQLHEINLRNPTGSWPTRLGSSLLPNFRVPSESDEALEDVEEAPPIVDDIEEVSRPEEAVVQQLRARIEALRRAEEDAMAQEISDDAVVLEIMNDREDDTSMVPQPAVQHQATQQDADRFALRQLRERELEGDDDDGRVRWLMEQEMEIGIAERVGQQMRSAEDQFGHGSFTFGLPARPEVQGRSIQDDVTRSREELLRQVGQDVLEDHHLSSDNSV